MSLTTETSHNNGVAIPADPEAIPTPKKTKAAKKEASSTTGTVVRDVPLKDIVLGANVRSEMPNMEEITESIRKKGVQTPGIGAERPDGKIDLIAGHRRYHACKDLKFETMPLTIVVADAAERHEMALVENIQREDMNPLDKALGIQKMMADNSYDQKEAARRLSVSDGYISQHLSLLKLPKPVQTLLKNGKLKLAEARLIGRVKDEETQIELAKLAPDMSLSQLQTKVEGIVQKERDKAEAAAKKAEGGGKKKTRAKGGEGEEGGDEETDAKKSLAEQYAELELEPLKKVDLREAMVTLATRLDGARTDEKRTEYKYILKGMEIAAGLKSI